MAVDILPATTTDRNREARRRVARLEVYRRAGRIGRGVTRAYVVAYTAWRVGDVPFEPDPADYGLLENVAAAWRLTVDMWVDEVSSDE
jgi:hypothetical protein